MNLKKLIAFIYDTETTGVTDSDRVVQHAVAVYDLQLNRVIDSRTWLVWESDFIVADSKKWHGWDASTLKLYGTFPMLALSDLDTLYRKYSPVCVIAHNAEFDYGMLAREARRTVRWQEHSFDMLKLPWLCTVKDAEYPGCPSKNLLTLTAFHGFLNPLAHDAIFDCFSLSKILSMNPGMVLRMAQSAAEIYSIVFANIPPKFDEAMNKKVKSVDFKWQELEHKYFYEKSWIRKIKKSEYPEFKDKCEKELGFTVNIITDIIPGPQFAELAKTLETI